MLNWTGLEWNRVRQRRWWAWLLVLLLAVLLALDLARVWRITNHHDLKVFLLAAQRLVHGKDIFADAAPFQSLVESGEFDMKDDSVVWPYMYPPLIALMFVPARWMPEPVVQAAWWGVNVLSLIGGTFLCLRTIGPVTPLRVALAMLVLLRFEPAVAALRLGQIELVQFALLALTLYGLSRGCERAGGACLGLATALKFFPGALIGLLIWRRRWTAVAWALGVALAAIVGSFALVGLDVLPDYLSYTSAYGIGGAFAAFAFNQSLNGFFSRNLMENAFVVPLKGVNRPHLARTLTLLCDAVVVAASAWLTWHRDRWPEAPLGVDARRFSLEYALAVVGLLLISPHSQVYAFVWALIPLVVLLVLFLDSRPPRPGFWVAYLVAYLLVGRHYILIRPGLTRLVQSHYLFGGIVLWFLLGLCLLGSRRVSAEHPVSVEGDTDVALVR